MAVLWLAFALLREHQIPREHESVRIGASEAEVISIMGKPSWSEPCGKSFGAPQPGCAKEFIYKSPFAPALPGYWSISFNKDGKVMDKYHYVSP